MLIKRDEYKTLRVAGKNNYSLYIFFIPNSSADKNSCYIIKNFETYPCSAFHEHHAYGTYIHNISTHC